MANLPSQEQHRALLNDCWVIARALPTSGVLNRGRKPYRAIRFERKLDSVANDPAGLLEYVRGMARRTSDGLESLVEYNRLDLSVEMLILDESALYASLFTQEDRAAAQVKLERQTGQVRNLAQTRQQQHRDARAEREGRIAMLMSRLPTDLDELRTQAAKAADPELTIAIARSLLRDNDHDVVAINRLGRAYQAINELDDASAAVTRVLAIDPGNAIALRRLREPRGRKR